MSNPIDRTLRTPEQLIDAGLVAPQRRAEMIRLASEFAISVSPAMQARMRRDNPSDPVSAQFIPTLAELEGDPSENGDPIGDDAFTPVPGIVHRYPDRVLLKPLHTCAVYCRFCFRREKVGPGEQMLDSVALERALAYIRETPAIWEVVITGGDPFVLSPRRLAGLMERLDAIEHVRIIRFHTRVPAVQPEAVDEALIKAIKNSKTTYVVLHVNHARELGCAARTACARIIDAGVPMLSQTVLLEGVNAEPAVLAELFRTLVELRIKPYYLHHGDLAKGTRHFRTSIAHGQDIMRALRGDLSGICQPLYVLDIPGGHGKVPIGPNYIRRQGEAGVYAVTDYRGTVHAYTDSVFADRAGQHHQKER